MVYAEISEVKKKKETRKLNARIEELLRLPAWSCCFWHTFAVDEKLGQYICVREMLRKRDESLSVCVSVSHRNTSYKD